MRVFEITCYEKMVRCFEMSPFLKNVHNSWKHKYKYFSEKCSRFLQMSIPNNEHDYWKRFFLKKNIWNAWECLRFCKICVIHWTVYFSVSVCDSWKCLLVWKVCTILWNVYFSEKCIRFLEMSIFLKSVYNSCKWLLFRQVDIFKNRTHFYEK